MQMQFDSCDQIGQFCLNDFVDTGYTVIEAPLGCH